MTLKKIGILCAMPIEAAALEAAMEQKSDKTVSGIRFVQGILDKKETVLAVCGVGKVAAALAAEALLLTYAPDALLNTGVAGGLCPELVVGDAVVADAVVQHDMNTTALGDPRGLISGPNIIQIPTDEPLRQGLLSAAGKENIRAFCGTVASGDLFVADARQKEKIAKEFGAIACEMEGAAIGQVAFTNRVPFAVLRTISDGGDGMEYSRFLPFAAARSAALTRTFLTLI